MSYLDIGFNENLTREVLPQQSDPFQSDFLTEQIDGERIDSEINGNLIGSGISAKNITSEFMSFNRAKGGTLNLGGFNNLNGIFALKDSEGIDKVTMDKDGIIIDKGSMTVKDQNSKTVIDAQGLVSTNNFNWYNIADATDRTDTGTPFTTIANTALNFILKRPTTVLFLAVADVKKDTYTAADRLFVKLGINIDGTLYPSSTDGFGVVLHYSDAASNVGFIARGYVGVHYLRTLDAGAHYATLQWANFLPSPSTQNRMVSYTSLTVLLLGT